LDRQQRYGVLYEFTLGGSAGGTGVVGHDQAYPADAIIGLQLSQGNCGGRVHRQIGAAASAFGRIIGGLGPAQCTVTQWTLLLTIRF
jgi:hypothetical protein